MGTDSVRMYSVWTGPSPGGGPYCSGNPGDASTVLRFQRNAPSAAATVRLRIHAKPLSDRPRMRSQVYGHGSSARAGVATSTPARTVTGVRDPRLLADSVTLLPVTVRSRQGDPTPWPTEHCAPETLPGSVTEMSACWILLFQDGAMTFQKNTDGDGDVSPVDSANRLSEPVPPGSRTPGTV